ncbi:MAG: hypothetical protein JWO32_2967 [Bacteroidetes bacterium]|nr:hypothetical protein [Bacteroidota bacterium]
MNQITMFAIPRGQLKRLTRLRVKFWWLREKWLIGELSQKFYRYELALVVAQIRQIKSSYGHKPYFRVRGFYSFIFFNLFFYLFLTT